MNVLEFLIDITTRGDKQTIARVANLQNRIEGADKAARGLSESVGKGLRGAIMSLPGAEFFTNPVIALSAGIGAVSRLGMQAEQTAAQFRVLAGSQELGNEMLEQVNEYAKDTPYSRLGVQNAVATMMSFNVASEDAMEAMSRLGDIAGGNQQRFESLSLVFAQTASAGKLTGQDLLQYINAGYNPLVDLMQMTGKSMEQLRDEMSKGAISFEMVRDAIRHATDEGGKYHGMMDVISESASGRFGMLQDTVQGTMLSLYGVIAPLLVPAFNALASVLEFLTPVIDALAKGTAWLVDAFREWNPAVIAIAAAVGVYTAAILLNTSVLKGWTIQQYAQYMVSLLAEKGMRLLNLAMAANPVMLVVGGVAALILVLTACWKKFAAFRAVIKSTFFAIKQFATLIKDFIIDRIAGLLNGIGSLGRAIGLFFEGEWSAAWTEAKSGVRGILGIDAAKNFKDGISSIDDDTRQYYEETLQDEREKQAAKEAEKEEKKIRKKKNGISDPAAAAGTAGEAYAADYETGGGSSQNTAETAITGGSRTNNITVNISKFFDNINVQMNDRTDTAELRRIILESLNRSLEIALSAAR